MTETTVSAEELRGWVGRTLVDQAGHKIGRIEDIYVDDATGEPEWLAVATGLFGRRVSFVPLSGATTKPGSDDIVCRWDQAKIKDAPHAEPDGRLSQDEEVALYRHYGVRYAPAGADRGRGDGQGHLAATGADPGMGAGMTPGVGDHGGTGEPAGQARLFGQTGTDGGTGTGHMGTGTADDAGTVTGEAGMGDEHATVGEAALGDRTGMGDEIATAGRDGTTGESGTTGMTEDEADASERAWVAGEAGTEGAAPEIPAATDAGADLGADTAGDLDTGARQDAGAGMATGMAGPDDAVDTPTADTPTADMTAADATAPEPTGEEDMVLAEEELHIGKERHESGRVRLRKWVETEHVTRTVPVSHEEAHLRREPIGADEAAGAHLDDLTESDREMVLSEEQLVVNKQIVPKERVRLEKETITEEVPVEADLRRERVEVEGLADTPPQDG
ncbi:MAG TPA: PRC and DUF2382 domain-containing protein [Acidimicrobiales bacterium]